MFYLNCALQDLCLSWHRLSLACPKVVQNQDKYDLEGKGSRSNPCHTTLFVPLHISGYPIAVTNPVILKWVTPCPSEVTRWSFKIKELIELNKHKA